LEFKTEDGLTREVPIVAARSTVVQEGDMLYLWVRFAADEIELAYAYEDDFTIDEEDDDEEGIFCHLRIKFCNNENSLKKPSSDGFFD
jgi:hypothetical protein